MFYNCQNLKSFDISNFDASNVQNMNYAFFNRTKLTSLDMFFGCSSLKSLDISHFNISSITNGINMFYICENLIYLDISNFKTQNKILTNMLGNCPSLKYINLNQTNFTAKLSRETI